MNVLLTHDKCGPFEAEITRLQAENRSLQRDVAIAIATLEYFKDCDLAPWVSQNCDLVIDKIKPKANS